MRITHAIAGMLVAVALTAGGCSFFPGTGPYSDDVRAGQRDPASLQYALVKLTPPVTKVLAEHAPRLGSIFRDRRPPAEIRFGVGDIVAVSIFEAAAGGLF